MPDLSHRPSRYATVAVAVVALAFAGYAQADVRFGPDTALTQAEKDKAALEAKVASLESKVASASGPSCATFPNQEAAQAVFVVNPSSHPTWDGDKDGIACEQLKPAATVVAATTDPKTCAAYGTQEEAQKVFDAEPGAHPDWDGDGDGKACEQLKPAAAPAPTAKKSPSTSATTTPSAPAGSAPSGSTTLPQSETPPVTAAPITAFTKAEIVGSSHHFGLYDATTEEYDGIEKTLARDTTIHGYFQGFDTNFRPERVTSSWQRGEIPMLTWESRPLNDTADQSAYSLAKIADGSWDAYLTQYAQDITATGLPLIIRFDHEMNGTWYRWSEGNPDYGNAPGSYIAAWKHIHDIFEANGANQYAIWDWAPNRVNNTSGWMTIDNFYPGDDYVDWVGITGYLRSSRDVPTFSAVFDKSLAALRSVAPGKPILLSEVGATENGGHKVAYVNDFFANIGNNPDIVGFMWFNYAISEKGATNDWRITSTTAVTDAFRAGLYSSGFGRDAGKTPALVPAGS